MSPEPKPSPRRLKRAAIVVVAFIALTIALIFIGENLTHRKTLNEAKKTNPAAIG